MPEVEKGRRRCRTCGESYDYPGHKSPATRLHCPQCVQIPAEIRRVLEIMRRRVERLAKTVEKMAGAGKENPR